MQAGNAANDVPVGTPVVDLDGEPVGRIVTVYPHYVMVERHGEHPSAFRVPIGTIARVEGGRARLSIRASALDLMTPEESTAFGLPHHGASGGGEGAGEGAGDGEA